MTVDFFGPARATTGVASADLELKEGSTVADLAAALLRKYPGLAGGVIEKSGRSFAGQYSLYVDGAGFVGGFDTTLKEGARTALMFASAGG